MPKTTEGPGDTTTWMANDAITVRALSSAHGVQIVSVFCCAEYAIPFCEAGQTSDHHLLGSFAFPSNF